MKYGLKSAQHKISIENHTSKPHSTLNIHQRDAGRSQKASRFETSVKFNIAMDSINIDLNNSTFIHEWIFIESLKYWWQQKMNFPLHFFIHLLCSFSIPRGKSVEDEKYHQLKDPLIFHLASILHVPKSSRGIFIQRWGIFMAFYFQKIWRRIKVEEFASQKRKRGKFKRITSKWCWNEKMRKSTSQNGFMRFHQLLRKTFRDFNLRKVDRVFFIMNNWKFI